MIRKYLDKGNADKVSEITDKLQLVAANGVETVQSFLSLGKIDSILNSEDKDDIDIELAFKDLLVNYDLYDKLEIDIENKENLKVRMHPKAFESILLNLTTNAIKYSDDFPKVSITVSSYDTGIKILFADNGIGIDLEKSGSNVFEPFVRINNNKKTEGSGVGLFLVKKIVNANNGSIEIESKLGKGTTFILSFEN
jgi:signal transduction histidine kinase